MWCTPHKGENWLHVCACPANNDDACLGREETPVSAETTCVLVWEIKVRFVVVCARNGPCVGKGHRLHRESGGVPKRLAVRLLTHILDHSLCSSPVTASASLPSLCQLSPDPHPLSVAFLLPYFSDDLHCSPSRATRSSGFTRTRRASNNTSCTALSILYRPPPAIVFACLYL